MVDVKQAKDVEAKMKFTGKVIKITLAGAIVDIGLDKPAMLHISQVGEDAVRRVEDVLEEGQEIDVWVRRVDKKSGRIELTMIEPLPLEWREIKKDMVVQGKVTRLEKFGAFVEIGAERPGLVHISELTHGYIRTPDEIVNVGDEVEAKVLEVKRRKKQIKLSLKALQQEPAGQEEDEQDDEPVPTAMELALRKAMQQSDEVPGEDTPNQSESKKSKQRTEREQLLARTLQHRVRAK